MLTAKHIHSCIRNDRYNIANNTRLLHLNNDISLTEEEKAVVYNLSYDDYKKICDRWSNMYLEESKTLPCKSEEESSAFFDTLLSLPNYLPEDSIRSLLSVSKSYRSRMRESKITRLLYENRKYLTLDALEYCDEDVYTYVKRVYGSDKVCWMREHPDFKLDECLDSILLIERLHDKNKLDRTYVPDEFINYLRPDIIENWKSLGITSTSTLRQQGIAMQ